MNSLLLLGLLAGTTAMAQPARFYLGTYTGRSGSQGIYTGTLDPHTGRLSPMELAVKTTSPSFIALSPDGKFLYAAMEGGGGSVGAFRVEADGRLTPLNTLPCDKGTCHVAVDATGSNVFAANYTAGSAACFQTAPDGSLAKRSALVPFTGSGPNPQRQNHPYIHSLYSAPGNRFVYACDLGTDNVWVFDFDAASGLLTPTNPPSGKVPPGSGPRHLALSPNGRFVYVNGEMGLNVTAFARNPETGALTAIQTLPTLPASVDTNGITTAEIFCHPSGRWLYVSNRDVAGRGRDSLAVYAIGADGKLTWQQDAPAQVKVPRGFGIDPTGQWLMVGGQQDNKIVVLKIDGATGKLSATDQSATVGAPVCVAFAQQHPRN
ncbi:MAG TPA: lactonase family protein [Candidatus Acidoferrum sp.]|nr:lactonase family protein [Candidatus Acidoferrum sp.]